MVARPHLSLVPANGLPARVRTWVLRVLALLVVLAAVLAIGYGAARYTSLFALRELEVTGGNEAIDEAVRDAARPFLGETLVSLDRDEVMDRLLAIPTVRAVEVDRAFPHTLRVTVVPESPLAVVRKGPAAWLVSDRGRVLRAVDPAAVRRPVVWTASEPNLEAGATVRSENVRLALQALRHLPTGFPERVVTARATGGEITLVLDDGPELRLGTSHLLGLKLAVAARVLATTPADEQAYLAYLDVSVPERVVGGSTLYSQVEG